MLGNGYLMQKTYFDITGAVWFPYRTGNLKNSVRTRLLSNGYEIIFDGELVQIGNQRQKIATESYRKQQFHNIVLGTDYTPYLEYGTKISKKHVGFIGTKSVNAALKVLEERYGKTVSKEEITYYKEG